MAPRSGNSHRIARTVTSCSSCLAWGPLYCQGMCTACYGFAERHRPPSDCGACGRREPLKSGYCRLCWTQAVLDRPRGSQRPLALYLREASHQQLFLAAFGRRQKVLPRGDRTLGCLPKLPPAAGRPRVVWVQLALFVVPRRYRYGSVNLTWDALPENPWLHWALHLAYTMAEARGFEEEVRRSLNRTLVMLLAEHRDGELIRSSDFHNVLRDRNANIKHTSEILRRMGVLLDDRPTTFEKWLAVKLDGLAPGIHSATERWARALHDGAQRSQARSRVTVKIYLRTIRPALLEWSDRYIHLREVTREDILDHLKPLHGEQRRITLVALRSLFAWAKKNGAIFRNPASQIKVGQLSDPVRQPLQPGDIAGAIEAATTPEARLLVALAAVHAARTGAIRAMQLDDVDLPNRRLTIAGHTRPLDELTHQLLLQWLEHRRRRWPNTANAHLLISRVSANDLGPVGEAWPSRILPGLPFILERLRIDRQLEEALTHRADPLHLVAVFDIDATTAIRYAHSARQLLEEPHETNPTGSPRTQGSTTNKYSTKHLGSH
jgi:hypothetical protein